jgi:hypothetical protein
VLASLRAKGLVLKEGTIVDATDLPPISVPLAMRV